MAIFMVRALALCTSIIPLVAKTGMRRGALTAVVAKACVGHAGWATCHTLAIEQIHTILAARASVSLLIIIAHEAVADVEALARGPRDRILALATGKWQLAAAAVRTRSAWHGPCGTLTGFDTTRAIGVAVEAVLAAETRNFTRRSIFNKAAKAGRNATAALHRRFTVIKVINFTAPAVDFRFAFAIDQETITAAGGTG